MPVGVYKAIKKDGTIYFRSSITYQNKHISLGSYASEQTAGEAYKEAARLLDDPSVLIVQLISHVHVLSFEKAVTLINFRDNHVYIKTPVYLQKTYFEYHFSPALCYKFDIDDLFYYSTRKIQKRGGHLFVHDYGMQYNILARYGIKNHGVVGKDYLFVNDDATDYRYSNIKILNAYFGVLSSSEVGREMFSARIHINGYFLLGSYPTDYIAAIAYNKACDLAKAMGIQKNFPINYIDKLSPSEYAGIYTDILLPERYVSYLSDYRKKLSK